MRGGKQKGSGRKSDLPGIVKMTLSVKIDPDIVDRLRKESKGKPGPYIEKLLRDLFRGPVPEVREIRDSFRKPYSTPQFQNFWTCANGLLSVSPALPALCFGVQGSLASLPEKAGKPCTPGARIFSICTGPKVVIVLRSGIRCRLPKTI